MREVRNPLIARLRVGSVLSTRNGTRYRVIEPVLEVAPNGSVVAALLLERTERDGAPQSVLMPIGKLINLMRWGGRHKPGVGAAIDWASVERREMTRQSTFLRAFKPTR